MKRCLRSITPLWILALSACGGQEPRPTTDLLLHNGIVLTLDEADTRGTALAITGDRIVAVGGEELVDGFDAAQVVDLAGRTIMPGFVDSHIHINGRPPHFVELSDAASVAEIRELVSAKAAEVGDGNWITGYGWSEDQLEEARKPTAADLEVAAPGHPVILTRAGGHSAVCSTTALELAGIDESTPDPQGGVIERDADGHLNGIIRERQGMVGRLVPPSTDEELRPSLVANLQALFAHGITSIVQAVDNVHHYPEWETIYAQHRGDLPRAAVQVFWAGDEDMAAFGRRTGDGDDHLRVGAIKLLVDGGFTGPAAFTTEPYKGEAEYRGKLNVTPDELRATIDAAHDAGWQLGLHAIGDAAIELVVEQLVDALERNPRADHRHYLNHFTIMPGEGTMVAMAEHGIAITQQPNFTYTLEGRYVDNLDGARLETNNPLRTPMNHGIHVAISSDILPIGPVVGLYAAVTRKGASGRVFGAGERLTMIEALRGYTIEGTWLTREENLKGTLEKDKLADFVVLSDNPLELDDDRILELGVDQTYLGGRLVYDASGASRP